MCQCVSAAAFTGEIGDGKLFISPVADIVRMCVSPLLSMHVSALLFVSLLSVPLCALCTFVCSLYLCV